MARQYRSTVEAKTLSTGINSSVTSMTLNSITTLPTSYPYTLVIDPDTATEEIVSVTALASGTTLTIVRAQDGTSGQAHNAAAVVKHMITARDLQEPQDHIDATAVHGATGAVVGTTNTQTLTNKTINLTSNTLTGTKAQFNTAISDADFATITGTETLTNKTLTSPIVTGGTVNGGAALTVDSTELNYVDGVTSAIQTQLDGKVATPGAWSSWTPTLVNLTLGSGSTAIYKYNQVGKTVNFSIDITFAGTSSGSGGSLITFTLPVTASGNYKGVFASGGYTAGMASSIIIFGLLSSGSTTVMRLNYPATGSFGASIPYGSFGLSSITAGSYLQIAGTYEAA